MPPSLPSWILFLLSVGLLSVLIHTPAIALSKISLSSINPSPKIEGRVEKNKIKKDNKWEEIILQNINNSG